MTHVVLLATYLSAALVGALGGSAPARTAAALLLLAVAARPLLRVVERAATGYLNSP